MQKKFNGILIHTKVFKDNDLLIKFLSDTDEVLSGIVYGGLSKSKKNIMQLGFFLNLDVTYICLLYTSPSPRDGCRSRMPSSA